VGAPPGWRTDLDAALAAAKAADGGVCAFVNLDF
jgi:hypothetical protein